MAKTAIAIGAVTSALAAGYGAQQQDVAARKSRKMTATANQLAQNSALKQEQASEQAIRRADKKMPDVAALLADQQQLRTPSTVLAGMSGVGGLPTSNLLGM